MLSLILSVTLGQCAAQQGACYAQQVQRVVVQKQYVQAQVQAVYAQPIVVQRVVTPYVQQQVVQQVVQPAYVQQQVVQKQVVQQNAAYGYGGSQQVVVGRQKGRGGVLGLGIGGQRTIQRSVTKTRG